MYKQALISCLTVCYIYGLEEEIIEHIFHTCPKPKIIWLDKWLLIILILLRVLQLAYGLKTIIPIKKQQWPSIIVATIWLL